MTILERTPARELEYYFEMRNGEACFLSEGGIFFFSYFSNTLRRILLVAPSFLGSLLSLFGLATVLIPDIFSPYLAGEFSLVASLILIPLPWVGEKLASYGRSKAFSGQPLLNLLANPKYSFSRRDWSEIRKVYLRHYRVVIKWNTSTWFQDRGVKMPFFATYYNQLKFFLSRQVGERLVEKP